MYNSLENKKLNLLTFPADIKLNNNSYSKDTLNIVRKYRKMKENFKAS